MIRFYKNPKTNDEKIKETVIWALKELYFIDNPEEYYDHKVSTSDLKDYYKVVSNSIIDDEEDSITLFINDNNNNMHAIGTPVAYNIENGREVNVVVTVPVTKTKALFIKILQNIGANVFYKDVEPSVWDGESIPSFVTKFDEKFGELEMDYLVDGVPLKAQDTGALVLYTYYAHIKNWNIKIENFDKIYKSEKEYGQVGLRNYVMDFLKTITPEGFSDTLSLEEGRRIVEVPERIDISRSTSGEEVTRENSHEIESALLRNELVKEGNLVYQEYKHIDVYSISPEGVQTIYELKSFKDNAYPKALGQLLMYERSLSSKEKVNLVLVIPNETKLSKNFKDTLEEANVSVIYRKF